MNLFNKFSKQKWTSIFSTIILSLSLCFFGLGTNYSVFNKTNVLESALNKDRDRFINIASKNNLSSRDIELIKNTLNNLTSITTLDPLPLLDNILKNNVKDYDYNNFNNVKIITEYNEKIIKIINGTIIKQDNEIIISSSLADKLLEFGIYNSINEIHKSESNDYSMLINKFLETPYGPLKIIGIFDNAEVLYKFDSIIFSDNISEKIINKREVGKQLIYSDTNDFEVSNNTQIDIPSYGIINSVANYSDYIFDIPNINTYDFCNTNDNYLYVDPTQARLLLRYVKTSNKTITLPGEFSMNGDEINTHKDIGDFLPFINDYALEHAAISNYKKAYQDKSFNISYYENIIKLNKNDQVSSEEYKKDAYKRYLEDVQFFGPTYSNFFSNAEPIRQLIESNTVLLNILNDSNHEDLEKITSFVYKFNINDNVYNFKIKGLHFDNFPESSGAIISNEAYKNIIKSERIYSLMCTDKEDNIKTFSNFFINDEKAKKMNIDLKNDYVDSMLNSFDEFYYYPVIIGYTCFLVLFVIYLIVIGKSIDQELSLERYNVKNNSLYDLKNDNNAQLNLYCVLTIVATLIGLLFLFFAYLMCEAIIKIYTSTILDVGLGYVSYLSVIGFALILFVSISCIMKSKQKRFKP